MDKARRWAGPQAPSSGGQDFAKQREARKCFRQEGEVILEFQAERKFTNSPFPYPHFANEEAEGQVRPKPRKLNESEFHN